MYFEYFPGTNKYTSLPIEAITNEDSTFLITGNLKPKESINWGLATVKEMTSLRHPVLGGFQETENDYSIIYVFSPIQSFKGLKKIKIHFAGEKITIYNKIFHYSDLSKKYLIENNATSIVLTTRDSIPNAIEYRFSKTNPESNKFTYLSFGGPLAYFGYKPGRFISEVGWEFGINPVPFISILPSINISFEDTRFKNWNFATRIYTTGYSFGMHFLSSKKPIYSFGISFGGIGIEYRSNTFYFQVSL